MTDTPSHKLWLPPKPAIIRAWKREELKRASLLPGFFPAGVIGGKSFPQIVQTATGNEENLSPYNAPLPAGINAGDLLLLFVSMGSPDPVTVGTPSGWSLLYSAVGSGDMRRHAAYYKIASGGEGATQSLSSTAQPFWSSTAYRIIGYRDTPEAGTPATGSSTAANPPSVTPSWGAENTLFIAAMGMVSGDIVTTTAPATYDNQITDAHIFFATRSRTSSAERKLAAASDNPGAFALSASASWVAATVAVRPA